MFEEISQLIDKERFLLDGTNEDIPSYGLMPDIDSIEQGISLAEKEAGNCSADKSEQLKTLIKNKLIEVFNFEVNVTDDEFEQHGYDEFDWEAKGDLFEELEALPEFAIFHLTRSWLCDDVQTVLLDIIADQGSVYRKVYAAKALEELESISIHGNIYQVLIGCFDEYDPVDPPYGEEERFLTLLLLILTDRLMHKECVNDLLKRTRQYEHLNEYSRLSRNTMDWYIDTFKQCEDEEHKVEIVKALACEWPEKGNLLPFLQEVISADITDDEREAVMLSLFLNFPYLSYTIEKLRGYLLGDGDEPCYMRVYDQLDILDNYSDNDMPEKRQMLEGFIINRLGDIQNCIKVYTRSYGMTASTFDFFVKSVEAVKDGHKTEILNLFLKNFPDCEQTQAIRTQYAPLI